MNALVQEGNYLLMYGCDYFYSLKDYENKMNILMMTDDVTSYSLSPDGS